MRNLSNYSAICGGLLVAAFFLAAPICLAADNEWESAASARVVQAKACKMDNGQCGGECSGDSRGKLCRPDPDDPDACTCQLPEGECKPKGDGCEGTCPFTGGECTKRDGVCGCNSNCAGANSCSGKCVGQLGVPGANPCKAEGSKCKCDKICKTVTVTEDSSRRPGEDGCGDANSDQCQRARQNCVEKLSETKCPDGYKEQPGSASFGSQCHDGGGGITVPRPSLPSILPFGQVSSAESGDSDVRAQLGVVPPVAAMPAPAAAFEKCAATCSKVCCK